jgi:hypothetical protein
MIKAGTALVTGTIHLAGYTEKAAAGIASGLEWITGWCSKNLAHDVGHTIERFAVVLDNDAAHETVVAIDKRPKHTLERLVRWISNGAAGTLQTLKIVAAGGLKNWLLSVVPGAKTEE